MKTYKIAFYGVVQGVGFRPFIYNFAHTRGIKGYVKNIGSNVVAVFQKESLNLETTILEIKKNLPPSAKIEQISTQKINPKKIYNDFVIKTSEASSSMLDSAIPCDLAICKTCAREMDDISNPRFNYAFINCINCGPRYSIIKKLPYDRKNTAMSEFKMCESCAREYGDKRDRRFHAQPNSCHKCGISLSVFDKNGVEIISRDNLECLDFIKREIKKGKIIAFKGVGGFNLICKTESSVIRRLRSLKNRPTKPFAIAFKDIVTLKKYFDINKSEERALCSSFAPIVLLKISSLKKRLPKNIAPKLSTIGVILAYSPLHRILFKDINKPLIFTSANRSKEPMAREISEMFENKIFDFLLDFNREIVNPIDDSVIFLLDKNPVFLRTARGFYPLHKKIKHYSDEVVLALGAHQKSQFAIYYRDSVVISPSIGDLDNVKSIERFSLTLTLFLNLYRIKPSVILCDAHEQYYTSYLARELGYKFGAKVWRVFHHRAHFYSCALDLDSDKQTLGAIFDGTGFGEDGAIWGGEIFEMREKKLQRIAHIKYFPLLGGNNAIKDIRKVALGVLFSVFGKEIPKDFKIKNLDTFYQMFKLNLNSPKTSSVGRLFDFVACVSRALKNQSYEGESGMVLESLYNPKITRFYGFEVKQNEIILDSMVKEILFDIAKKSPSLRAKQTIIASKFINTFAHIILHFALEKKCEMILSGGVFQNRVLCDKISRLFRAHKLSLTIHSTPNDGGIALGQIGAFINGDVVEAK